MARERFIDVDFTVLVASHAPSEITPSIKSSTRWPFQKASALYVSNRRNLTNCSSEILTRLNTRFAPLGPKHNLPAYAANDLPKLVSRINTIHSGRTRASENQRIQKELV